MMKRRGKDKPKSTSDSADYLKEYDIIDSPVSPDPQPQQPSEAVDIPADNGYRNNVVAITPASSGSYKSHESSAVVSLSPASALEVPQDKGTKTPSESKNLTPSSCGLQQTDYMGEIKQKKKLYLTDSKRCMSSELTSDDCLAIIMSKSLNNARTDRSLPEEITRNERTVQTRVTEKMETFLQELERKNLWSSDKGFHDSNPNNMFEFFLLANQIIQYNGTCFVCVLCGKRKDPTKTSSIFPEVLLGSFQRIHGEEAGKMACASNSDVPLFCSDCDGLATKDETYLRNLYLTIMDPSCQDRQIEIQNPGWLLYILAAITFRGLFVRNFIGELQNSFDKLIQMLATLRLYLVRHSAEIPSEVTSAFRLYILPHGMFSVGDSQPNICMSQHLRLPQPTTIVKMNESTFLYAQFDCFHWVFSYSKKEAIPGLAKPNQSCFSTSPGTEPHHFISIDTSEKRKRIFPEILIRENYKRVVSYQMNSILISHESLQSLPSRAIHGASDGSLPSKLSSSLLAYPKEIEDPLHQFETIMDDEECEEIYKSAKKTSPFSSTEQQRAQVSKDEQMDYIRRKCQELEIECSVDSEQYREKLKEQATEIDTLRGENDKLRTERASLMEKVKELEEIEMLRQRVPSPPDQSDSASAVYEPPLRRV